MAMQRFDDFQRTAEMLASVLPTFDAESTSGKAAVMRALLGSTPVNDEARMLAVCACGWRGTMLDTRMTEYASDPTSWHMHAGRQGWHYLCPACGAVIWKHYTLMS